MKYTALSALTETGEVGRLQGYASRFGEPDQAGDVVAPGAFATSLETLKAAGRSVKFLWQHDPTRPIGVWQEVMENKTGLWVSGEVLTDLPLGKDAAVLMAAGAIDGLSIGYRVVRAEKNRETGGRTLLEIDLWEVSLVTFPMLPTARAEADRPIRKAAPDLAEAILADGPEFNGPSDDDLAAALAEALVG
ncbi:MAG: HK97 family phage prohead protease [Pseudomonadota bacterium]